MVKLLRWTGYVVGSLVLLLLIAAAAIWLLAAQKLNAQANGKLEHLAAPSAVQLADAPRQLYALRCLDCHGKGLRGNLFFNEPSVAKIYAPNLTEIAARASDEQLARALRQGIGIDGRSLVIMPSATFSRLNDGEVAALIATIRSLPRGGERTPEREVGFLGRLGLVTGKFHTSTDEVGQYAKNQPLDLGPQYAAGRHIAASNCAECHGANLEGGEVEPGLNAPDLTIAGSYDLPAFIKLMRTGVPPGGRELKLMSGIARKGLSHMSDAEIEDLHAYLQARTNRLSR
jgi:mono/diheme cytochrome c family protein